MMKKRLNRLTAVALMAAVLVTGSFAITGTDTYAASMKKPVIKKASVYDNNKVKLTWSKVKGAKKYEVWRKIGDGKYKKVKTTTKRTYYHKKLSYATKYTYKVRAVGKYSKSKFSKIKRATTKTVRPKITSIEQTGKKLTSLTVKWKKVKGAKKYKVYEKVGKNGSYKLKCTTTKTKYVNTETKAGKRYWYKVKAVDSKKRVRTSYIKSKFRQRTVKVKVPKYYNGTVWFIRETGPKPKVLYKTTSRAELDKKREEMMNDLDICPTDWSWGANGLTHEYWIITGYYISYITKTDYNHSNVPKRIADGEDVTVVWEK